MSDSKKRSRALAVPKTKVGKMRYNLYKQAYEQINNAMKQGFYLEAITLIESLVSDRLESRLTYLKRSDFSFKTLGTLIKTINQIETDILLKNLVSHGLNVWRDSRNKALHEMIKLEDGEETTWDQRKISLLSVAEEGLSTLRSIDKRCKELRKLEQ